MKANIAWQEGVSFLGQVGSGHSVLMDGAPEAGGKNLGPRPMEMILLGLGGCTAFDVVHILRKGRQAITGCQVEMDAQRATEDPKVFTR
ncbi:MAG: OsmC family protein, partial [Nitrosomonas sp.]|nr:OsmC family protein [Nitrosomonas sp.]